MFGLAEREESSKDVELVNNQSQERKRVEQHIVSTGSLNAWILLLLQGDRKTLRSTSSEDMDQHGGKGKTHTHTQDPLKN